METATIKSLKESNSKLQESLDKFKNYHIEKNIDIHEIKYGQENEYCINDIINLIQKFIGDISFLTDNHELFIQTSTLSERNDMRTNISTLNTHIINRSYSQITLLLENLKIKIRIYELFINKDRFIELSSEIDILRSSKTQIFNKIEEQTEGQMSILENNANSIRSYEEEIKNYKEEYNKRTAEADKLITEAKNALNYKNAEGLSAAFDTQLKDAKGFWNKYMWVIGAFIFIVATIFIGMWIVTGWWLDTSTMSSNQMIFSLVGRLSIIPFTIAGAIFCANQYTKQKNIIEDYAYKTAIAKSIIAFSEELREKSPERYAEYLSTILKEIHQDPLRKRGKEKEPISLKGSQGTIEKAIELLQSAINKIPN